MRRAVGKKKIIRWRVVAAATVVLAASVLSVGASAQAALSERWGGWGLGVSPFIQSDWAISTANYSNPYNEHGLTTKGNHFNMFAFRGESLFDLNANPEASAPFGLDSIRIFVHPRFYSDIIADVDGHVKDVDLMGGADGRRYPGNGWLAELVGTHEYNLDLVEAYAELRRGGLRLRLGKQQIAWGTSIFLRSLDSVDSLDLRRHVIVDEAANEYSDTRISEWTAAVTYSVPVAPPGVSDITM